MNIVIVGAHPDDPEAGCGGLAIKAVQAGHRVVFLYLSSGHAGKVVLDRPEEELREDEARAACKVCGAEPHFFRYPMSDIPFNQAEVKRMSDFLRQIDADLLIAHWPVDSHPDHQACGALATQTVVGNPDVALAYYESAGGCQTIAFPVNRYVDISDLTEQKIKCVNCHVSQNVPAWWPYHDTSELFHGAQIGAKRAEAYCLAVATPKAEEIFTSRAWLAPSGSRTVRKSKHEDVPLHGK